MLGAHKTLGLALTDQGVTAVLADPSVGRGGDMRTVSLAFTDDINLGSPDRLGRELRRVLREAQAFAPRCVAGLPASCVVAREKTLPAADEASLRGALSIAAEREFASGGGDLAFDYTCAPAESGSVSALLVAAPRKTLDQLEAMAKAAGLTITAVTPSAAALAAATGGAGSPGRLVLCLLPRGAELTEAGPSGPRLIRHLPVRMDAPGDESDRLLGELRRVLATAPAIGAASAAERELLVWDAAGMGRPVADMLGRRLGMSVRLCNLEKDMGIAGASAAESGPLAQAAALAWGPRAAAGRGAAPQINFIKSRMTPPAASRLGRPARLAVIAAAAALVLAAWFFLDWRLAGRQADSLRQRLDGMKASVQEANALVANFTFARAWYDRRPPLLDCLRQITEAFPDEGRVWATRLTIREDAARQDIEADLSGKGASAPAVTEVSDRLGRNPRLSILKDRDLHTQQTGQNTQEVSFSIGVALQEAK
jgi:hypothetical protein